MAKVAFLGTGAMGSRMASNLLKAGHAVTVWNRNTDACAPLVAAGAEAASTPRAAVAEADFAISMLRDDAASAAAWLVPDYGALGGLREGSVGIESSTLTTGFMQGLAEQFRRAGRAFLDAPVAGSRPQAEAAQLIYLVGGDADVLSAAEPVLRTMGGAVHHAGPAGSGTTLKLGVNALLAVQVAALAEIIGLFAKAGLDPAAAVDILGATPVCSPAAKGAAMSMLSGAFAPMFPVDLVEKDLGNALTTAKAVGAAMPVVGAVQAVFEAAQRQGLGAENLTGVVRLYG